MRSQFEYLRPETPQEAVAMKSSHGEKAMYWAGGTDMILHWQREKYYPEFCIDLTHLSAMDAIAVEADKISIGAMVSLTALENSGDRHHLLATLSVITKLMCTPQTRTIATVGGNMCNASPAADLSPAFVAMDADAVILGQSGERRVSMFEFFEGVNKTALCDGELLSEIVIPLPASGRIAVSYKRIDRTVVDIALVNASSALTVDNTGTVTTAVVALGSVAPVIVRSDAAGSALVGRSLDQLDHAVLAAAGEAAAADAKPISDVRASAQYRRDMVKVMTRRSVQDCIDQLKG
jgi:carbon-monoxide dehydrogenase medium subunit